MGNYNSKYESYYSSIVNNKKIDNSNYCGNNKMFPKKKNFVLNRITRDLCGVFILFLMVIVCKLIVTPRTVAVYKYSKNVVNTNLDYKAFLVKLKGVDKNGNIQEKAIDLIDRIKANIMGGETIKQKIKERFALPTNGQIESMEDGINIGTEKNSKISATYTGKVRECGSNHILGNYIVIDHGEGIESVYANLDKILVKKNDAVIKGDTIAKQDKKIKDHIKFKVLFMGKDRGFERLMGMAK